MAHLASGWFCLNADDFIEALALTTPTVLNVRRIVHPPRRIVLVYHIWAGI